MFTGTHNYATLKPGDHQKPNQIQQRRFSGTPTVVLKVRFQTATILAAFAPNSITFDSSGHVQGALPKHQEIVLAIAEILGPKHSARSALEHHKIR